MNMKVQTYACDVCSIQKQPSNNWWKVYVVEGGAIVLQWDTTLPFDYYGSVDKADAHLCGQKCILEWLSKSVLGEVKP